MKKFLLSALVVFASYFSPSLLSAQSTYRTAAGLAIDFGKNATLAGPTIKAFLSKANALEVQALLGSNYFSIGAFYQYHLSIKKESALKFYIGAGPEVYVGAPKDAGFLLRPMAGFDYKVKKLPLSLTFDLRPKLALKSNSTFEVSRFNFGARYAFR